VEWLEVDARITGWSGKESRDCLTAEYELAGDSVSFGYLVRYLPERERKLCGGGVVRLSDHVVREVCSDLHSKHFVHRHSHYFAREIKKRSKLADPWRLRDDFLRMKPNSISALSFLGKWGRWVEWRTITGLPEMLDLQQAIRKALVSSPKEWLSDSLSSPINLNSRTSEFPYLSMVTDSCAIAIRMTTTIDLLQRLKFRNCARPDCRVPFAITSKHKKDYCTQYCAHLESVRRNRKPRTARQAV
jgi:hypothetical protein